MTNNLLIDDLRQNNRYDVECFSEIGKRAEQQDFGYLGVNDNEILAVICDGMGGIEGGAIASRVAVEKFVECYGYSEQHPGKQTWMQNAADLVDETVYSLQDNAGNRLNSGTTLVAVNINDNMMSWVSVGDSRLYIIRNGEILQITNDHNYFLQLNQQLESGEINKSQYYSESRDGEALISFIGMGGLTLKDVSYEPIGIISGDTVLLCTDGVYRALSDEFLLNSVICSSTAKQIEKKITDAIDEIGAKDQDNYTLVIIRIN